jgi:hypothetical protein
VVVVAQLAALALAAAAAAAAAPAVLVARGRGMNDELGRVVAGRLGRAQLDAAAARRLGAVEEIYEPPAGFVLVKDQGLSEPRFVPGAELRPVQKPRRCLGEERAHVGGQLAVPRQFLDDNDGGSRTQG